MEEIGGGGNCSKSRDNLGLLEAVDIRGTKERIGKDSDT